MASELAAYYVSIVPSAKGLTKSIGREFAGIDNEASKAGKSSGGAFSGAFKASLAGIGAVFAAAGIGSFVSDAVKSAGDIEQSFGALDSVFKSSSGDMRKWSKDAAKNVGLTSNEFNELGTLIGSQLKNGGTAMEDLAPKTNELIGLGADLSSMFGGSAKDAVDALSSALKGERDPIERYGVSLNQAKIDAEAAALGFEKVDGALSAEASQAATMSLIMKQTSDAHGNFAKESDTFAHKQQVMAAQWGDLKTRIGDVFMPVFSGMIGFFSDKAMPVIGEVVGGVKAFAEAFKAGDGDITSSGFPGFMERLGDAARGLYDLFTKGDYTGALKRAFGWEEDHPLVDFVLDVRDGAKGLYDLLTKGDYTGLLHNVFGWEEDSKFVDFLLDVRDRALEIPGALKDLASKGGDVAKVLWDMREPIGIIAGLILTVLIPHWMALAVEALKSAVKQVFAWAMTRGAAVKAAFVHSGAVTAMIAGWVLLAARAVIQAGIIAGAWLIALGPVAWVIAAIAAVVGAFVLAYNNIGWFKDGVDSAMRWVGEAVANAFEWVQDVIGGVVDWFTGTLVPAWDAAVKGVSDFFKGLGDAVGAVFKGVQDAIQAVVTWFNTVIVPAFQAAVGAVVAVFQGIYNFLKPVFDSIAIIVGGFYMFFEGVFNLVVAFIQKIVIPLFKAFWDRMVEAFTGIGTAISDWWAGVSGLFGDVVNFIRNILSAAFTWFRDSVIKPVFDAIGNAIKWVWDNVLLPLFNGFMTTLRQVGGVFKWLYENAIKPIFDAIGNAIRWVWDNVLLPLFNGFMRTLRQIGDVFKWLYEAVIKPVFEGVGKAIKWVWDTLIKPVFDTLSNFITKTIPKAFEDGVKFIKTAWDKIQEIAKAPVRFVINTVINDGLIAGFNNLARPLGVKELGRVALPPGFAEGGYTGPGAKYQPAGIVHAGEYVFTKEQTRRAGVGNLAAMAQSLNGYAKGGIVNPLKTMALTQGYNRVHKGIDLAAAVGTPVYASQGGRVTWAGPGVQAPGVWGGNEIHIAGDGIETWFAHLSQIAVKLGQPVRAGQQIGLSGNTGISSGPHLHFGTFAGGWPNDIDPLAYLGGAGIPSGGGFNPIQGIIDGLMSKIKEAGGGPFADIAIGIGKKVIDSASKFVTDFLSGNHDKGSATATLYDGGGWLENTGGAQLVQHNKRKPDAVLSSSQWDTMTRIADNAKGGFVNNGTIHVRDEEEMARVLLTRQRDAQAAYGF